MNEGEQNNTLPALDNEMLRKENTRKIVDAIDNVGQHFQEVRKWNKITITIGVISSLIVLIFLGTIVYSAFSIKGQSFVDSMVDRDTMSTRFKCCVGGECLIIRQIPFAKDFTLMYPEATCTFWDVRNTP